MGAIALAGILASQIPTAEDELESRKILGEFARAAEEKVPGLEANRKFSYRTGHRKLETVVHKELSGEERAQLDKIAKGLSKSHGWKISIRVEE